jgi:hypothetical protein
VLAGRLPFGDDDTSWCQNRANGQEEELQLQQWKVRVEGEHHRLSSCPNPKFRTMATGDEATRLRVAWALEM